MELKDMGHARAPRDEGSPPRIHSMELKDTGRPTLVLQTTAGYESIQWN